MRDGAYKCARRPAKRGAGRDAHTWHGLRMEQIEQGDATQGSIFLQRTARKGKQAISCHPHEVRTPHFPRKMNRNKQSLKRSAVQTANVTCDDSNFPIAHRHAGRNECDYQAHAMQLHSTATARYRTLLQQARPR